MRLGNKVVIAVVLVLLALGVIGCSKSEKEKPMPQNSASSVEGIAEKKPVQAVEEEKAKPVTAKEETKNKDNGDSAIKENGYIDKITGMKFVEVKGGCYQMGDVFHDNDSDSDYEKPVHEVCVDDFYIGQYEVTQGQWKKVMGNNPSGFKNCGDNCPVEQVSWHDAQKFISRLNSKAGDNKYRLPTEAEWEYAARNGGKKERYSGGNNVGKAAWYSRNSNNKTHPVGTKAANGLGIYDMSGNVWEWVQDCADDENYYNKSPKNNPKGPASGMYRILRGGAWSEDPDVLRTVMRFRTTDPGNSSDNTGFRLARTK